MRTYYNYEMDNKHVEFTILNPVAGSSLEFKVEIRVHSMDYQKRLYDDIAIWCAYEESFDTFVKLTTSEIFTELGSH